MLIEVKKFYDLLPFNFAASTTGQLESILGSNQIESSYPDLHKFLKTSSKLRTLDLGCGVGWLSCTLAHYYGAQVTGVDFSETAITRAKELQKQGAFQVEFICGDLWSFDFLNQFDLICSVGVLHHTENARKAFAHAASFLRPSTASRIFLGLYHDRGRAPFLNHFRRLLETAGTDEAFLEFQKMFKQDTEMQFVKSWYLDQVCHPHETQHSAEEVQDWLNENRLTLLSTSLNGFGSDISSESLKKAESDIEIRAIERLSQKVFFPGFFTTFARPSGGT